MPFLQLRAAKQPKANENVGNVRTNLPGLNGNPSETGDSPQSHWRSSAAFAPSSAGWFWAAQSRVFDFGLPSF